MTWPRSMLLRSVAAGALVVLATAALRAVHADRMESALVFVLVVLVVLAAAFLGVVPAGVAVFVSFGTENYFFTPPRDSFRIAKPDDLLALGVFVATAAIVSLAVARVNELGRRASRREQEVLARLSLTGELFSGRDVASVVAAARIRAALRRTKARDATDEPFAVDGVVIDVPARRHEVNGFATHLTPTEWRILEALVTQPGRLVSHRQLVAALSGTDEPDSPVVRVHVNHLRPKLGDQGARPRFIVNEYGLGYRWLPGRAD